MEGCLHIDNQFLLEIYNFRVDLITEIVDSTDITIIPTINPDGFDRATEGKCSGNNLNSLGTNLIFVFAGEDFKSGRLNERKKDINRDFPTWRDVNSSRDDLYDDRQPETKVMIDGLFKIIISIFI